MIPKSILFYWSKGADIRRQIILMIYEAEKNKKPCFLNMISKKLELSHVAVKKHIDLLIEEKYVEAINPSGKPVYLKITKTGYEVIDEFLNEESKRK